MIRKMKRHINHEILNINLKFFLKLTNSIKLMSNNDKHDKS